MLLWECYKWNNAALLLECNKHEILLLSSEGSVKTKKRSNLTPIKPMFVELADTWQSYTYTYCRKTALKEVWLKRTITQTNFWITSTKFLNRILSSIWKVISQTQDSIFLFEKAKYLCGKIVSTEEFWHDFKGCHLGCLLL